MRRVHRADDCRIQIRVGECKAENELHRAYAREQVVELCQAPAVPLPSAPLLFGGPTFRRTTADDDPRPGFGSRADRRFVLALDRRIGDLENVEHARRDMVRQVRQGGGDTDEPHFARLLEFEQRVERAVLLQGLFGWRGMELDDVEIVSLHPSEALLDALDDIFSGEDVGVALPGWSWCRADQTAAFAGQIEFRAPMRDVTADPLFAQPIVDRSVDIVDAGVEHGVEDRFRLGFGDIAGRAAPHAAPLPRSPAP